MNIVYITLYITNFYLKENMNIMNILRSFFLLWIKCMH